MAVASDRQDARWSRRDALGVAGGGLTASAVGTSAAAQGKVEKEITNLGMPWEEQYGYAQAIKVGDTIYVSGQLSHDEGNMVAPAPLDPSGKIADHGNMGAQMAQSYATSRRSWRTTAPPWTTSSRRWSTSPTWGRPLRSRARSEGRRTAEPRWSRAPSL